MLRTLGIRSHISPWNGHEQTGDFPQLIKLVEAGLQDDTAGAASGAGITSQAVTASGAGLTLQAVAALCKKLSALQSKAAVRHSTANCLERPIVVTPRGQ